LTPRRRQHSAPRPRGQAVIGLRRGYGPTAPKLQRRRALLAGTFKTERTKEPCAVRPATRASVKSLESPDLEADGPEQCLRRSERAHLLPPRSPYASSCRVPAGALACGGGGSGGAPASVRAAR
jgi:hypothetical protein